MANKTAARKAQREVARKRKRRGTTSTASQGLVLRVFKNDPDLQWLAGFVQQFGEKLFDAEHTWELDRKKRLGWIKISRAIAATGKSLARDAGNEEGFLKLLDRVGQEEGEADLGLIQAELEAWEAGSESGVDAEERRREERHQAELAALNTWQENQRMLVRLVVFAVLFAAAMISFGALTRQAVFIGIGVAGAMAVGLIKALFSGSSNPFSAPRQLESAPEEGSASGKERCSE